jgi:hypothetical protein
MYTYLKSNWKLNKKYTAAEKETLLLAAKNASQATSTVALDFGTNIHKWLNKYIVAVMTKSLKPKLPTDELEKHSIKLFLKWEKQHNITWLASELIVSNDKYKTAGTIDYVAIVDGHLELGDWKTGHLSENHFLQTAAYQKMLEGMLLNDVKIDRRTIMLFSKDLKSTEITPFYIDSDVDFDWKVFLCLRQVSRFNVYINNHHKLGHNIVHYYE